LISLTLEFQQLSQSGISRARPMFSHTQDPSETFRNHSGRAALRNASMAA